MAGLGDIEGELRDHRDRLTPLELDQIKKRAMTSASRAQPKGGALRARFITALAVVGLLGGTGGVLAASQGGTSNDSAAKSQYRPGKDCKKHPHKRRCTKPKGKFVRPRKNKRLHAGQVVHPRVVAHDDRGVRSVTFFVNHRRICTDRHAPYTCRYRVRRGNGRNIRFTAVITDVDGNKSTARRTIRRRR